MMIHKRETLGLALTHREPRGPRPCSYTQKG